MEFFDVSWLELPLIPDADVKLALVALEAEDDLWAERAEDDAEAKKD